MPDIGEISRRLAGRAEEVARSLFPNGKRVGQEWCAGDTNGGDGKSLKVHLSGSKAGLWCDFATGESGDLLDLMATVKGVSLSEVLREAKSLVGIVDPRFNGARPKTYRKPVKPACRRPAEGSAVMNYLTLERKLTPFTIQAYQVAEGIGEHGPEIIFPYKRDGELVNVKYLALERDEQGKKITKLEGGCMLSLFGWQTIPADTRAVVITEGELDAMSWGDLGMPALSVPNGAKSFTWIENEYEALERFETIYLSWDQDEDGQKGVLEAVDRLGRHRCRVVTLPYKDANECLQRGVTADEMNRCLTDAQTCDPAELKRASSYVQQVIDEFYPPNGIQPGFAPPWAKFADALRFRPAELSIWSGFNGTGKTTMLNQIILAGMSVGERACIASLEIKPRKLLRRLTRQAYGVRLPSISEIQLTHEWYDDRLWIFELVGSAKADRLFEVFEYARQRYGVTQFVIDSLMRCGIAEDDYSGQKRFTDQAAEFATSHEVHVHLVAHSRKRDNDSHEASRLDVRGAGAITDLAHNVFIVKRSRDKERQIQDCETRGEIPSRELSEKPDALLVCDKTREGEWTGRAPLWFHLDSLQYLDDQYGHPTIYVTETMDSHYGN
jgi:twinkle protein